MTKREIIKAAYGDYWDKIKYYVDENGHLDTHWWNTNQIVIPFHRTGFGSRYPESLAGLEKNNDWIKIESMDSFPNETIFCITCIYLNKEKYQLGSSRERTREDLIKMWQAAELTHYRQIDTKPPIY